MKKTVDSLRPATAWEQRCHRLRPQAIHGWDTQQVQALQRQVAEVLGQPVTLVHTLKEGTMLDFALIPPGEFLMGSPAGEVARRDHEHQHRVTIGEAFYLGKYPVTQAQWEAVLGNNPSHFKGANLPVESVSWTEVQAFLQKLNARTGQNYRLPTEAEWEYACRAGTATAYHFGDDASGLGLHGWYKGNSLRRPHAVGTRLPNPWGLYDLHGNVWEWTGSLWAPYSSGEAQRCGGGMAFHVLRGGSWGSLPMSLRSASRYAGAPDVRHYSRGFRLVLHARKQWVVPVQRAAGS